MNKKPTANLREAANAIVQAEFECLKYGERCESAIYFDPKSGKTFEMLSSQVGFLLDSNGEICLWHAKAGLRSLSDLVKAIESNPAEPFHGYNFFEWYLKFHFSDRIEWR